MSIVSNNHKSLVINPCTNHLLKESHLGSVYLRDLKFLSSTTLSKPAHWVTPAKFNQRPSSKTLNPDSNMSRRMYNCEFVIYL
jgi:hypothetical protein